MFDVCRGWVYNDAVVFVAEVEGGVRFGELHHEFVDAIEQNTVGLPEEGYKVCHMN